MELKLQKFIKQLNVTRLANINYFEFVNKYHTSFDEHNFYEMVYVDKGELDVISDNFTGIVSENQLIIHSPNETHSLSTGNMGAPNIIIIGFECDCSALSYFSANPVTLSQEHKKSLACIMTEGMSIYEPPYDDPSTKCMKKRQEFPFGADQMIKNGMENLLISLVREFVLKEDHGETTWMSSAGDTDAIRQYIDENFNTKITLDNLCFLFRTNKTTLCKKFRQEYGETIFSYINKLKINEAKILLRENQMSVTEIAEYLHYNSVHYFSRHFKKLTGMSPSEYVGSVRSRFDV